MPGGKHLLWFVVLRSQFKTGYEFPAETEIKPKLLYTRNPAFYPVTLSAGAS